jgi:GYF domain 2
MPEYYYLEGITKHGPYSLEELQLKKLAPDTLVWHATLKDWVKAAELAELRNYPDTTLKSSTAVVSIQKNNLQDTAFAVKVKQYRWAIAWFAFHLCALFLSYNEVKFFNSAGAPKPDKFWPFVKFTLPYFIPDDNATHVKFNGLFTQYDWTEFCFYVGIVVFFLVLVQVYKKSE